MSAQPISQLADAFMKIAQIAQDQKAQREKYLWTGSFGLWVGIFYVLNRYIADDKTGKPWELGHQLVLTFACVAVAAAYTYLAVKFHRSAQNELQSSSIAVQLVLDAVPPETLKTDTALIKKSMEGSSFCASVEFSLCLITYVFLIVLDSVVWLFPG